MKKKIIMIIGVIILADILGMVYDAYLGPEGVEGEKQVNLEIIIDEENINETYEFNTDLEFLSELLKENQDKLGVSFQEHDFGKMVTGLKNYEAEGQEFFHISVNGEEAERGIEEIPLQDGDTYKFELIEF